MPIGSTRPMATVAEPDHRTRNAHPHGRPAETRVQAPAFPLRGFASRSAALVEPLGDPIEAGNRMFDFVGDVAHLASIGVSGEVEPSSLPWFTPSARAM